MANEGQERTKLPPLNLAQNQVLDETTAQPDAPAKIVSDVILPELIVMVDIESLALGSRPVITQVAMLGYDLNEDELLDTRHVQYYPVEPQQQIIPPRRIMASTIDWWMHQSDEARNRFKLSTSTDFQDLPALARNLITVFNQLTNHGKTPYELVARGPQFDIVALETLIEELGLEVPWHYDRVRDLRTMMAVAGITTESVEKPAGFIPHVAFWDARWQIACYVAAKKALASR